MLISGAYIMKVFLTDKKLMMTIFIVCVVYIGASAFFWVDYNKTKVTTIKEVKKELIQSEFKKRKEKLESLFKQAYQATRTISLLPSIRSITGGNRKNDNVNPVKEGRFTTEGELTVQQLYNNLASNVSVSEIYAVVEGLDYTNGEVPFFMYDSLILSASAAEGENASEVVNHDFPDELEDEEYSYYPQQISYLKENYPLLRAKNLDDIPAISSPPMRTCDNTQYISRTQGDPKDSFGILYSVPFYSIKEDKLKGVISAVFRINVLEAILLDIPHLLITNDDKELAKKMNFSMPSESSPFFLINKENKISVNDRRDDTVLSIYEKFSTNENKDLGYVEDLQIKDESTWQLFYSFHHIPWKENIEQIFKLFIAKISFITLLFFSFLFILKDKELQAVKDKENAILVAKNKSDFLAHMGHEIRTPLNTIIGVNDLLTTENLSMEEIQKYLKMTKASSDILLNLINDILDLSKIEAMQMTLEKIPVNVQKSIDEVHLIVSTAARRKNIPLKYSINIPDNLQVMSDPTRLKQVIINLVNNAIKFTHEGFVQLTVKTIKMSSNQITLFVGVRDTGIGISKEAQAKIFDEFVQADISTTRNYAGTGLGLSISKKIISLFGGQLEVKSALNHGSCFYFYFTAPVSYYHTNIMDGPVVDNSSSSSKKILLVDDSDENIALVDIYLKDKLYTVDHAYNGEEAISLYKKNSYDFILMDAHMPVMNGKAATKYIRKIEQEFNFSSTPIFI